MRVFKFASVLIFLFVASGLTINGQCKAFSKKNCLPELGSYTHDGNYHATVLTEGEEAELYKTFYSDMDYRMVVCSEESLPVLEFTVMDVNKNILFSSKDNRNLRTWDFKLESSQQLRIILKVKPSGNQSGVPSSGCVSIMFGFRIKP